MKPIRAFLVVLSLLVFSSFAFAQDQVECVQKDESGEPAYSFFLENGEANHFKASPQACGYGKCTFNSDCCGGDCHFGQCRGKKDSGGSCGYGKCTFNSDCCGGDCHFGQCRGKKDSGGSCGYGKCTFNSDCCGGDCHFGECRGKKK